MSAYMISDDHACALVTAYLELRAGSGKRYTSTDPTLAHEATAMVRDLMMECHRSISYRYPMAATTYEPNVETISIAHATFAPVAWQGAYDTNRTRTLARTINAARCYAYQACEHPEWVGSDVCRWIDDLVEMAASQLARLHDSTWGVTGRDHFTASAEVRS